MDPQKFIDLVLEELGIKMENGEKVTRAVFGMSTSKGLVNGVGEDAPAEVILAKYDELNGYMTKDGYRLKNRVFFDAKTKKPIKNPKLTLLIRINGEIVEHKEGEPESLEIQLAKKQIEDKEE